MSDLPIPISVLAPLVILQLILMASALVDLLRRDPERVNGSKVVWAVVIIFLTTLGPILYFVMGRKE